MLSRRRRNFGTGNRQAAAAEERMVSAAKLEARKAQLAVKQELVEKAFQRALELLLDELPEATYTELLACLAAQQPQPDRRRSCFPQGPGTLR